MPTLIVEHRHIQPAMGSAILVWEEHPPHEGLFDTVREASTGYLRPNPRLFGHTWRFYPRANGDYAITATDEEITQAMTWLLEASSSWSF